jgi:SAM-dependent methyltransferase
MSTAPVRALHSLRARGVGPTLGIAVRESRRVSAQRRRRAAERRFDRRLGVETAATLALDELRVDGEPWDDARKYEPAPVPVLDELLDAVPADPACCAFVDLGSGKARAVLAAADRGFARAIGVELSERLHAQAEANAAAYRARHPDARVELVRGDATAYAFPAEPLVLFLYDPFGEDSVRRVAANLQASLAQHPREAHVAYCAPHYGDAFDAIGLTRAAEGERWASWRT